MTILQAPTTMQVLHVKVNDVYACIDLAFVEKVISLPSLEDVPGSFPYLAGLMNLAGCSVPVIDLSLRLGLERTKPYSISTPLLLCSNRSAQVGIIVDEIIGLAMVTKDNIQTNNEFTDKESLFLASIVFNSNLSLLVNIEKILAIDLISKREVV